MALNGGKTIVAFILLMCIAKVAANPCAGKTNVLWMMFSVAENTSIVWIKTCEKESNYETSVVCKRCPSTGTLAYRRDGSCICYTLCFDTVNLNCAVKARTSLRWK